MVKVKKGTENTTDVNLQLSGCTVLVHSEQEAGISEMEDFSLESSHWTMIAHASKSRMS